MTDISNPAPTPTPEELLKAETDRAIKACIAEAGGKLVRGEGVVAVTLAGTVRLGETTIPYSLIPPKGTLGKIGKWRNMAPEARLATVRERINPETAAALNQEVAAFVVKASLLCQKYGLDPARFWDPLRHGGFLAASRFQLILDRIEAAGLRAREEANMERTRSSVQLSLYPESFHLAHSMKRRFIAVLGPTNSGKTHTAMEALAAAGSGVYLAPLRLLALENYERLQERGVKVSLVTGEERRMSDHATHVASTVEMLDIKTRVEVAVIDEIQMLDDVDRGAGWTAAVCGVPADVVYLVGSATAKGAIEALAARLNVPVEFHILQRKAPLAMEPQPIGAIHNLRKGDALIAFSRRDVLRWRDQLTRAGFSVATIYGNLSPEVRRAQARRFRDGEADIVCATDALGMGLNLPVSRVVFTTSEKYDGYVEDEIPAWLAQQIAGRAGRFGMHESGAVAGFDHHTHRAIAKLLKVKLPPIAETNFSVAPTIDHLTEISAATGETRLAKLLDLFARNVDVNDEFFMPANLAEQMERAEWLDGLQLSLEDRFLMSLVPVSTRIARLQDAWETWAEAMAKGEPSRLETESYRNSAFPLQAAEDACKKYSAYAWLSYRRPELFPDGAAAVEMAGWTSIDIDEMLQRENAQKRPSSRRNASRKGASHKGRHRSDERKSKNANRFKAAHDA